MRVSIYSWVCCDAYMGKKEFVATMIGGFGLVGMFFFPSPEENFLYYLGFIAVVVGLIIFVLKKKKFK